MRLWGRRLVVAAIMLGPVGSAGAAGTETSAEQLLRRVQARYDSVSTFSAHFTQVFSGQGIQQRESGEVIMKKPGKMRWEYRQPHHKIFVSDGRSAYFYVPDDRQVMVSELESGNGDTPLLFLFGQGDLALEFEVRLESEEDAREDGNVLLRLEPRQPRADFSHVLLEVDPATAGISRLTVVEPIGSRNDYLLSQIQENIRVPDRTFRFKIPPGVEVIRQ